MLYILKQLFAGVEVNIHRYSGGYSAIAVDIGQAASLWKHWEGIDEWMRLFCFDEMSKKIINPCILHPWNRINDGVPDCRNIVGDGRFITLVRVSNKEGGNATKSEMDWIWSDVFTWNNTFLAAQRCTDWHAHEPDPQIIRGSCRCDEPWSQV